MFLAYMLLYSGTPIIEFYALMSWFTNVMIRDMNSAGIDVVLK